MDSRPRLTLATRESVLAALLAQNPDAWVVAAASSGLFTAMPDEVPLRGHHVVTGYASGLDMVVPADRPVMIEAWHRMLVEGGASVTVHALSDADRPLALHFLDLSPRYGVIIAVFLGLGEDDAVGAGQPSDLVPRTMVIRKDESGVLIAVDDASTAILGWAAAELVGRRTLDLIHPDDHELAVANFMDLLARPGASRRIRLRYRHRDGHYVWMEITNHNHLRDPDQPYVLTEMVDINDEVAALEALRANEQMLRRLTEALPVGVLHISADRTVTYRNERLSTMVGVPHASTVDEVLTHLIGTDRGAVSAAVEAALDSGHDIDVEASFHPGRTKVYRCVLSLRSLTNEAGQVSGAIGCLVDITDDANLREELEQRVRHDPLTGCYNQAAIRAELAGRLVEPRDRTYLVVMFIDLDGFKAMNDRYGHITGDRLLRHVATRLRQVAGEDGLVGRLGGDEFLVVVRTGPTWPALVRAGEQVAAALDAPIQIGPQWTTARASIGLAFAADGDLVDAATMVGAADQAMYEAKRRNDGVPVIAAAAAGCAR